MNTLTCLQELFDEDVDSAIERSRHLLTSYMSGCIGIVLYGAGCLGRKTSNVLRKHGVTPLCFSDAIVYKTTQAINGIPVLSPNEAASLYGKEALFVVTILSRDYGNDFRTVCDYLHGIGVMKCVPFYPVGWAYPDELLPHYAQGKPEDVLQCKNDILKAFNLFHDERSRNYFYDLASVSINPDYYNFSEADKDAQYFSEEILRLMPPGPLAIVDCGAYDGDTLSSFLDTAGPERIKHWYAFEPDGDNYDKLCANVAKLPIDLQTRITCCKYAVGAKDCTLLFDATSSESSCISCEGLPIKCVSLDSFLNDRHVDVIKMDVEGFETEALKGSMNTIMNNKPFLMLSIYHRQRDFFEIPLLMSSVFDMFVIRRYMSYFYDSVLYCY